jgi:hypothetical protein
MNRVVDKRGTCTPVVIGDSFTSPVDLSPA